MPADRKTILKSRARTLRKTMTETEIRIWNQLRRRQINGLRFLRQHPLGKYIVDFYCPSEKLVIEIDGGQHYESGESTEVDRERDDFLFREYGIRTLRFTNTDVMRNIPAVIDRIFEETSEKNS